MTANIPEIRRGVVSPMECLKEGWAGIKDQYWLFLGIIFVGAFVGGAVPVILYGPMMCGVFLCLLSKLRGQPVEFATMFKGFDYFVPGLVAAALQFAPMFILIAPFYVIMFVAMMASQPSGRVNPDEASAYVLTVILLYFGFMVVVLIVSFGVMIFFMFPYALIVDRKMSGLDAVKTSIKAGAANFGGIFGLVALNFLLICAGVLACYVGAFLTMPITWASYATAYRKVFGDPPEVTGTGPQAVDA
jgi:hypothetical protein